MIRLIRQDKTGTMPTHAPAHFANNTDARPITTSAAIGGGLDEYQQPDHHQDPRAGALQSTVEQISCL